MASAVASKVKDQFGTVKSQVRAQTANLSDQVADFTAAEPVKAMLIAAAAGAVLMALLSMMVRSDDRTWQLTSLWTHRPWPADCRHLDRLRGRLWSLTGRSRM